MTLRKKLRRKSVKKVATKMHFLETYLKTMLADLNDLIRVSDGISRSSICALTRKLQLIT